MIYIVTAMYAEAHALIAHFQLKKDAEYTRFQVFCRREPDICLIITGTGNIAAAVAVSSICTELKAGDGDFLMNVGVCAGINTNQTGQIFLCNKIKEQTTGKTFYPDMLYRHSFAETQILTGAVPFSETGRKEAIRIMGEKFFLYDMEAASVYQAGVRFLGPHQMSFLKLISDNGDSGKVTPDEIQRIMDKNINGIAGYIEQLQIAVKREGQKQILLEDTGEETMERLCQDMHCSEAMRASVMQHIRYCILAGIDYKHIIQDMYLEEKLPCKDKKEGKQCFEEFKRRVL